MLVILFLVLPFLDLASLPFLLFSSGIALLFFPRQVREIDLSLVRRYISEKQALFSFLSHLVAHGPNEKVSQPDRIVLPFLRETGCLRCIVIRCGLCP